jgi:hypothetical protein
MGRPVRQNSKPKNNKKPGNKKTSKAQKKGNHAAPEPVKLLSKTVIMGTEDIESEISELRKTAENQAKKLAEEQA